MKEVESHIESPLLDAKEKQECNVLDAWISGMPNIKCNCKEASNCTYLPENSLYCMLTKVTRKNCPGNCPNCPVQGINLHF